MTQSNTAISRSDWQTVWASARERLRRELGEATFEAWIAPLTLVSYEGGHIQIGAAKAFARNWVANHYAQRIERALQQEGGNPNSISIVQTAPNEPAVGGGVVRDVPRPVATTIPYVRPMGGGSGGDGSSGDDGDSAKGLWNRMLHPQQTFESFVGGPENDFGLQAVRAFAGGESEDIPLLYIHGGFGFGKTHLLNAAALEFRKRGKRTLFLRAEDFMRHFLGALYRKDTLAFKEELRSAEVLIVDDLQHICRSSATASELLHTVNAFSDLRRRVVIAAALPPAGLEGLGADVRSRLGGGLVLKLDRPDRDTRLAILKARAAEFARHKSGVVLADDVLERIAAIPEATPRDIIGVFTKLATYADLTKKLVTLDVAEEAIGSRVNVGKTSIEDIQRKTAEYYKLEVKDFHSPQRARRVARPRQVAMYLARQLTSRSLPEIGRRFGGRDHTTVLHACRRIEELCAGDPVFRQEVDFLKNVLAKKPDA
jgi:chromosomal replication initiator protein